MKPIPEASEPYHRARKQTVLWSSVLLAWELIGIDLAEISGGPGSVAKSIQRPEWIPIVLVLGVIYFYVRFGIERAQLDKQRTEMLSLKVDHGLTSGIGAFAILVASVVWVWPLKQKITASVPAMIVALCVFVAAIVTFRWLGRRTTLALRLVSQEARSAREYGHRARGLTGMPKYNASVFLGPGQTGIFTFRRVGSDRFEAFLDGPLATRSAPRRVSPLKAQSTFHATALAPAGPGPS